MKTRSNLFVPYLIAIQFAALILVSYFARAEQAETPVTCVEGQVTTLRYGDHTSDCALEEATDLDAFQFFASANDVIRINVLSQAYYFDPVVELRRQGSPEVVVGGSCSANASYCSFVVDHTVTLGGTYLLSLFDGGVNDAGAYVLQIERTPPAVSGAALDYDDTITDSIDPQTDIDFWAFAGRAGTTVRFSVLSRAYYFDPVLELRAPDGTPLEAGSCSANASFCSFTTDVTLPVDGTYLAFLSDGGINDAGGYQLTLQCLTPPCPPFVAQVTDQIGVHRPSARRFFLDVDGSGNWTGGDVVTAAFGSSTDIPVIGDWNGDDVDEIGVWRPSNRRFYLDVDGSDSWTAGDVVTSAFGFSSDVPVVGDWNGDGVDEIGVWRPGNGRFFLDVDGSDSWTGGDSITAPFGFATDVPVVGDWNADGVDEIGVWRKGAIRQPGDRRFYLDTDGSGSWTGGDTVTAPFGFASDSPVIGDWNGDGADKIGVWRPSNRRFYLDVDGSDSWTGGDTISAPFGFSGDSPVAGRW